MYIGKVAKLTGTTPKAIRLYENLGLIPVPERKGTYRIYKQRDVDLIRMIKEAQRLGFKLSDMRALLQAEGGSVEQFQWDTAAEIVQDKIDEIGQQIEHLQQMRLDLKLFMSAVKEGA